MRKLNRNRNPKRRVLGKTVKKYSMSPMHKDWQDRVAKNPKLLRNCIYIRPDYLKREEEQNERTKNSHIR